MRFAVLLVLGASGCATQTGNWSAQERVDLRAYLRANDGMSSQRRALLWQRTVESNVTTIADIAFLYRARFGRDIPSPRTTNVIGGVTMEWYVLNGTSFSFQGGVLFFVNPTSTGKNDPSWWQGG